MNEKVSELHNKFESLQETFSDVWELASDLGVCMNGLHNAYASFESFETDFQSWQNENEESYND